MKKILITLLVCTSIFSCSKDDNTSPGSGKESYKPDAVIITDEPVMYTKNGIIHDQAIIKDYVTRRGGLALYAFGQDKADASLLGSYTLNFTSDKNVLLGNIKGEIISKNDTLMMIAAVDASTETPGQKSISDSLMDKVDKNGPLAECPTYYTAPCPYKKKYPLLIVDGQYYIPYVVATVSTNVLIPTMLGAPMDYTSYQYKNGQSIIFNESMTTKLGGQMTVTSNNVNYIVDRNDTLIIQKMRRHMTKQ